MTSVVSGYFGSAISGVYDAPLPGNSFFFCNNVAMTDIVKEKGWDFILCDFPCSEDPRISALQAKYVKFLQFNPPPSGEIVYADHKLNLTASHLSQLSASCTRDLLVRTHPRENRTLQDEIMAASKQPRYAERMKETVDWLNTQIQAGGIKNLQRIDSTGLIYYKQPTAVKSLCDDMYSHCWRLGQPECQIIWAIESQNYDAHICRIDWNDIDILWEEPPRPVW